jgi:pimeloyl-ACP methyl ester carboxylesterase
MASFALLHGGAHGGWCWEEVVPELERRGHRCSAPDLPLEDPHGPSSWADTVLESLSDDGGPLVVVGHSMGGLAVPIVAERAGARRMVFVAAVVPIPGRSFAEVLAAEPDALVVEGLEGLASGEVHLAADDGDEGGALPWSFARASFYHDLPEEQARAAWRRLRTQGLASATEPCPLAAWPDIPSTYVLMRDDRAVNPAWSRRVAAGRLGAELVELDGGHSPFYRNPGDLAEVLHRAAAAPA